MNALMRALKDNHFNNSFSQDHQDQAREVSLEVQVVSLVAQVVSRDLDRDSREEAREVSQAVVLAASLEVPGVALEEALAAILKCQWDRPQALLHKCNNYPLASHSKVPVV